MTKTMSLREASRNFGVPRGTIQTRLKRNNPDSATSLGRYQHVFGVDMENELKRRVLEMKSAFYGITTMDLRL